MRSGFARARAHTCFSERIFWTREHFGNFHDPRHANVSDSRDRSKHKYQAFFIHSSHHHHHTHTYFVQHRFVRNSPLCGRGRHIL